jgi:23S rRNA pseudouridine1911/1915/1917 synthase
MSEKHTFKINEFQAGIRIDQFLSLQVLECSRTRIKALMEEGAVLLNTIPCDHPSYVLKANDQIMLTIPEALPAEPQAQNIPLDIVFEDKDLLVLNKPAGLVVHPGAGHHDQTLVNALLAHCGDSLSGIGGVRRPGIVHRLDKDTTGLMVVAKNDATHHALQAQFSDRTLSRSYKALVWGCLSPSKGVVQTQMGRHPRHRKKMAVLREGGREAVTHYSTDAASPLMSVITCELKTGRTHQIRVHMAHLGCPLVGDPVYGKKTGIPASIPAEVQALTRQALHAFALQFVHPTTQDLLKFKVDLPPDLANAIKALRLC